ncbi:hypothetical protein GCM10010428_12630 [Actinosynnema pretiosum subsp. pretiosum]
MREKHGGKPDDDGEGREPAPRAGRCPERGRHPGRWQAVRTAFRVVWLIIRVLLWSDMDL